MYVCLSLFICVCVCVCHDGNSLDNSRETKVRNTKNILENYQGLLQTEVTYCDTIEKELDGLFRFITYFLMDALQKPALMSWFLSLWFSIKIFRWF